MVVTKKGYIFVMWETNLTLNFRIMYFDVKAFNKGKRRFENLDNIDELNTFVWEWYNKGFTKFVIKSYDESGFRRRRFLSYGEDFTMNKIGWDKQV